MKYLQKNQLYKRRLRLGSCFSIFKFLNSILAAPKKFYYWIFFSGSVVCSATKFKVIRLRKLLAINAKPLNILYSDIFLELLFFFTNSFGEEPENYCLNGNK